MALAREQLDALVGQPMGRGSTGPDPVNQPMIRHWAAAFEDANPVYTDPDAAARSRFGRIVAPPTMLQTWSLPTVVVTGIRERGGSPTPSEGESVLDVFDEAGYTATLAANSEFEIERYLHLGEVVSSSSAIEEVSDEKQTRIGNGYFVTWVTTYAVGDEVVGRQRFRIFRFKP